MFCLGIIFIMTVDNQGTDNGSIRIECGKKKHTGRKLPTMAIRLGFQIENFFLFIN